MAETPIAFDLDGTLIDARRRQVGAAVEVVSALGGVELDAVRFWRAKRSGASTADAFERLGYESALAASLALDWRSLVETDEWLAQDRALPGVARVLERLRRAGRPIVVLSARSRPEGAPGSLEASGLGTLIDELAVVDPSRAVPAKAKLLKRSKASSFIGDTESDAAASAQANVPFVAVATGQRTGSYLRARGCDVARSLRAAVDRLEAGAG